MLPTASDPEFHSAHVLQFILQDVLMEAPFSKWWKFKLLRTSVDCGQKQGMNTQLLPPQTLCFKMNHFWFQSLLILYPHLDGIFTVYFCTTEQVFISEFSLAESFLCNSVQLPSPFRIYSGGKENNTDASIPPLVRKARIAQEEREQLWFEASQDTWLWKRRHCFCDYKAKKQTGLWQKFLIL